MIDAAKIAELLAVCDAATPGPWNHYERGHKLLGYDIDEVPSGGRGAFEREEDAAFCCAAREHFRPLLERLAELEEKIDRKVLDNDMDERISIRKENGYYVYDLPGCNCGPFSTWREAYHHADSYLQFQDNESLREQLQRLIAENERLLDRLNVAEAMIADRNAHIERLETTIYAARK